MLPSWWCAAPVVMGSGDYTLFESFVALTDSIWWYADNHPAIGVALSTTSVLSNWAIFRYHLAALNEPGFLMKNLDIAGRFSRPTYEMWKWMALAGGPLGSLVVLYSLATQFNTVPFLATFGIRGAGPVKRHLILKTFQTHTLLKHINLSFLKPGRPH